MQRSDDASSPPHFARGTERAVTAFAKARGKPMKLTLNFLAGGPQAGFMYASRSVSTRRPAST